jgi:type IV pilus assembly protein PilC
MGATLRQASNNQNGETMATASKQVKDYVFEWEGKDRNGKTVRGETRAIGENQVSASLRRQGVVVTKVKKRKMVSAKRIKPKDIAIFTRQLATMMKAGVPLLQAFDIVGRGNPNPSVTKLLNDIRTDVETGTSLSAAFRKHPLYFNALYCNLVEAGEAAGILEDLLDRLALYMEKTEAIKSKVKSALMYPTAVIVVAFVVVVVIMIFVIPAFKEVFSSFGADLPAPTLAVIAMSEFFVAYWWLVFGVLGGGCTFSCRPGSATKSAALHGPRPAENAHLWHPGGKVDRGALDPHHGHHVCGGVPLVEALDSVGGASGNSLYADATKKIQQEVSTAADQGVVHIGHRHQPGRQIGIASPDRPSG